ncbi:hypothetical protein V8C44DRAFT_332318 [Trichoderma aethiopicum]
MSTTNDTEPRSPNSVQVACGFGPSGQAVTQTPWRYDTVALLAALSVFVLVSAIEEFGAGHASPISPPGRFGYRSARLVPVVVAFTCYLYDGSCYRALCESTSLPYAYTGRIGASLAA